MKFKKIALSIAISLGITACNITYATDRQMTIEEIDSRIIACRQGIEECNKKMDLAHSMAETARQLSLAEGDEVITKAQEIYSDNERKKNNLIVEIDVLECNKKEIETQPKMQYVGNFKLTGYCPCRSCSGGYGTGTASGARAKEGITIAADRRVLPLGTKVYIEGVGERIVQDVGGAIKGNKIDIYVNSHSSCYKTEYNQTSAKVYIID